jgi:tripartite-type tricarboxylate transporter receptor subunit TctC
MTSLPGLRVAFAMIAVLGIAVGPAPAQDASGWPTRPIRLVVGFGAGGGTDIAARLVAEPLAEILGSPVVVENRPGAGGMTAADAVAKSPKDGYTALMMSNAHAISAVMYKTLRYDPVNDFQMVSMVATAGLVLVARPDFLGNDVAGVLAVVRANPGKLNFGSAGVGTTQQFAGELMKQTAGLNVTHVPYAGDLKAIAVTSPERNPILPEVPTFKESGMPDYDVTSWYGIAFPSGTPPAIVQKTNNAMRQLLARENVGKRVAALGARVRSSAPEELKVHIEGEIVKWKTVREMAGIEREQ